MNRRNIALFCGGDSSECEVSVLSALNVFKHIDTQRYEPFFIFMKGRSWHLLLLDNGAPLTPEAATALSALDIVELKIAFTEVEKTNFSATVKQEGVERVVRFDKVFIMVHGTPGENGLLQGYLEMMGIPFTTCSSFVSAITFDKHSCKRFLDYAGVTMAKDVFIRRGDNYSPEEIVRALGLPMFLKPTVGGSSFGITKVKSAEELPTAIEHAFGECDTIIAEEAITGRELTCGVYKKGEEIVKLPVIEIITEREFFDYEAKYSGFSQEICPAQIDGPTTLRVQEQSEKIYKYMGCDGIVRIDYILTPEGDLYFLEVNTVPGMTKASLVPKQLDAAGISLKEFISELLA